MKAALLVMIGAVLWAIGWWQVSGEVALDEQVASMNLAIVGFLVIGVGQSSWFLAGRRAVGTRRRALLGEEARPSPAAVSGSVDDRFAGHDRFYHRLDCAMLANRGWARSSRSEQEAAGRVPCGVCAP